MEEYETKYELNWQGLCFWFGMAALFGAIWGYQASLAVMAAALLLSFTLSLFD